MEHKEVNKWVDSSVLKRQKSRKGAREWGISLEMKQNGMKKLVARFFAMNPKFYNGAKYWFYDMAWKLFFSIQICRKLPIWR